MKKVTKTFSLAPNTQMLSAMPTDWNWLLGQYASRPTKSRKRPMKSAVKAATKLVQRNVTKALMLRLPMQLLRAVQWWSHPMTQWSH